MRSNVYSDTWFSTFLAPIPAEQTQTEVNFLARQFPLPAYSQLLDVCSGPGRHSIPLARLGYDVTGLDFNEVAVRQAEAKAKGLRVNFILGDQRTESLPPCSVHGILVLWQSFGFFTPMENRRLLEKWNAGLKSEGRLVLDVYNRNFFSGKDCIRTFLAQGGTVTETKKLRGSQLSVKLKYSNSTTDDFHWEVFTAPELTKLAEESGFALVTACSLFDESVPVNENEPRMQLVFQKKIK